MTIICKAMTLRVVKSKKYFNPSVYYTLQIVATLGGSVLLGFLTEYITNANKETPISPYIPYVYAMALSFCSFISLAMGNLTFHNGWMIALRIKIILTGAIFQKVSHPTTCFYN